MTHTINTELLNVDLTKWPRLVVVGDPVTREQAMEILVRTDRLEFSSNDAAFSKRCASYLYGLDTTGNRSWGYWTLSDAFEGNNGRTDYDGYQEYRDKVRVELQPLGLRYLENSRIVSTWIGGTYGWCDWDGTIGCSNNNIGKWPTVGDVYEDWKDIARAFPYLDLRCQLITDEGEGDLVVEYHVEGGTVTVHAPGPLLQPVEELDDEAVEGVLTGTQARSCSYEQFVAAVDYTRAQVKLEKLTQYFID